MIGREGRPAGANSPSDFCLREAVPGPSYVVRSLA